MAKIDESQFREVWRWRKRVAADADTLSHWESLIDEGFVPDGTLRQTAGRKTAAVEVFTAEVTRAEDLQQVFGGAVERVDAEALMRPTMDIGRPLKIRNRLVVTESVDPEEIAALEQEFPRRAVLSFPPELAFGTGRHATTGTCLRLLADIAREREKFDTSWRMLDLGHGSGILAVAAATMGAERVAGIDFDPKAVAAGVRNADRHRLPDGARCSTRCDFSEADITDWQPPKTVAGGYQVVAANLFADLLVMQLPRIARWLSADGDLVLSGILRRQVNEIVIAAAAAGLTLRSPVVSGKWVAIRGGLSAGD